MKKTMITLLILLAGTSMAYAEPDWSLGRGWNKNMLKRLTYDCVSAKMADVQTETAAEMLEKTCFNDVLAGRWDKTSRKKYEKEKRRLQIEIEKSR